MTSWKDNSIVWAKYGNFPYWPALLKKINETANECAIFFFGEDLKGIVKFKALRKWTKTLDEKTKKEIVEDKSMAFAYGIALKYIQKEFEFKHHAKFIELIDKKKVINDVKTLLSKKCASKFRSVSQKDMVQKISKERQAQSESKVRKTIKTTQTKINRDRNKPIVKYNKQSLRKKNKNKDEKKTEQFLRRKRERDSSIEKSCNRAQTVNVIEQKKATTENILGIDNKEAQITVQSLVFYMKEMETSKNSIQTKYKNLILLCQTEEENKSTIQLINNSINQIEKQLIQFYDNNYKTFLKLYEPLFTIFMKKDEDIEMNAIDTQNQNLEDKLIGIRDLTPNDCLISIKKMRSKLSPHILSPEIAKYVPLYNVFKIINKELNDDNLGYVLFSLQLFYSQFIKGSFLYRAISNITDDYRNIEFRSKIREVIKTILSKIVVYLSLPITESLQNNIVNYLELRTAKKDPTIENNYKETMRKLLNAIKEELVLKSTLISTILV